MHFKATKTGTYAGACYQFCGLRHSDMRWVLDIRSQSDFQTWVNQTKSAQGLDTAPESPSLAEGGR
jgi:cytochrome c oxidase subunit 2